jgi:hypothetical protein
MRPVAQYAARPRMIGKDRCQHVAGRAANIDDGRESRKIVSCGDSRRLLAMDTHHHFAEK